MGVVLIVVGFVVIGVVFVVVVKDILVVFVVGSVVVMVVVLVVVDILIQVTSDDPAVAVALFSKSQYPNAPLLSTGQVESAVLSSHITGPFPSSNVE